MKTQLRYPLVLLLCAHFFIFYPSAATGQQIDSCKIKTDINMLSFPFKIRPSIKGFPSQLNASFNAALYLGKRKEWKKKAYGSGLFAGLGAAAITPYVTQQKIDYEYEGLVISTGIATVYDIKQINLGLAIGIDHLMDKNSNKWIYQHKPWFGLLFGMNLN